MIAIDGKDQVLGRLATKVAKLAIDGEKIYIVNVEKVIVSGSKDTIMKKFYALKDRQGKGNPEKGPKFYRMPDTIVRRAIRGMLPFKTNKGQDAYKRIITYIGVPEKLANAKMEQVKKSENKLNRRYMTVEQISKLLGAKW